MFLEKKRFDSSHRLRRRRRKVAEPPLLNHDGGDASSSILFVLPYCVFPIPHGRGGFHAPIGHNR